MPENRFSRLQNLELFCVLMFVTILSVMLFQPWQWYDEIQKPSWNPPVFLCASVWSVLCVLIGASGWRVWSRRSEPWAKISMRWWVTQWLLNNVWLLFFFGLKQLGWALFEIVLLLICIAAYIASTYRKERIAAYFFIPYFLWVSFVTVLNGTIWYLNG